MKYRKKPLTVDAFRYDGDLINSQGQFYVPSWAVAAFKKGDLYYNGEPPCELVVYTMEGDMRCDVGDWIIRGVAGEIYPCKNEIFELTYEKAN